ncbi:hypothetical protein B5C00_11095 [Staphylococcus delphini]|uniref:hypothetical protein n=1 Tax=Staphylococcus delphini TaxID=53344 RepID=UPI000BBCF167|nr:hypothetical protein [Staphylococcus delphini]PCF32275.1 hypothetical protein B5C00_11095 [Staphylococcus delphini]UXS29451.1 hypothetical protein MUA33_01015 [Staphylococcus delphini]UXS37104.1 hypothetical protein MUA34_01230 [Staphylococcus delphini]
MKVSCVCDANVWIDACHCDSEVDYLRNYFVVGFVEQVHNEIVKFEKRKDKFRYIYTKYQENQHLYKVLKLSDLKELEVQFLHQLRQKNFDDIDNSNKAIKNLGEYASLYFAFHLKIPYIHTTDLSFIEEEAGILPGIEMKTWNEICDEISIDDDDRMMKNKIIQIKKEEFNRKREESKKTQKSNLDSRLAMLVNKMNNRRNK